MKQTEFKTSGVILRTVDFKDNDKIFDVFTEDGDIVSFFGRGAKKQKSKFFGVVSIGNFIHITYSSGKNLNYPKEISYNLNNIFKFQTKSLDAMYFYSDVLVLIRLVSKDFHSKELYELLLETLNHAELNKNELTAIYNSFLKQLLEMLGADTEISCFVSGQTVQDKQFYYHPESNKVFSIENRPNSMDLPLVSYDAIFCKNFLQKKLYEILNTKVRLKF